MSYNDILGNHLDRILSGKEVFIPNPYGRMSEIFNLHKSRMILIGSLSGVGKTSLLDDMLLKAYEWCRLQGTDYHFEVPYYSMERSIKDKIAKWISWKIYQDRGIKIPSNVFAVGVQGNMKLTPEIQKIADSYRPWMDELLSKISIEQGPKEVSYIRNELAKVAKRVCSRVHSDDKNIFVNDVKKGEFNSSVTKSTVKGNVMYRIVNEAGEKVEIQQNQVKYILKNPNTFVFPVFDHLGKTKISSYHRGRKQAIDELVEVASEYRDDCYMSPFLISQFNRSVGDITRIKYANGSLEPITDDFKETNDPVEAADLIVSPFDPFRYNSFSKEGLYNGYNIADSSKPSTLSPSGVQRFRSLHFLKNSYGPSQVTYGMRFTGEVMDFKLLPPVGTTDLNLIYQSIARGE